MFQSMALLQIELYTPPIHQFRMYIFYIYVYLRQIILYNYVLPTDVRMYLMYLRTNLPAVQFTLTSFSCEQL